MDFISGETIAIDKPLGWTSFDVVKRIRGAIQRRMDVKRFKVGHAGTLDPLATGVLIVCTGRGTRNIDALQNSTKEYVATLRLGATTPSFDLEKEIDTYYPTAHITPELIDEALAKFQGSIMQVPPIYSAVKIDGKRAYKFARKGAEVELKPKALHISEIELLNCNLASSEPSIEIRVVCSKGTYIRALARDIGLALRSGAHLTALRRTRVGQIKIEDAMSVEEAVEKIANTPLTYPEDYKLRQ